MNSKLIRLWLMALLSEFIEGCADSFLVVSGGAAVAQTGAVALPTITPLQLLYSVLIGGVWYAASYLKKTPLPSALPQASAAPLVSSNQNPNPPAS